MREAVRERIRKLPRRDRRVALRLMREKPIRILGGCLECARDSQYARVGIYVPQDGSLVQQVVVYSFCRDHAETGGGLSVPDLEQRLVIAVASRPHVPVIEILREGAGRG